MSTELPLRCACGGLRGVLAEASPAKSNRMLCYCDDCQAFARFLGHPGTMDEAGGTEILQVAPARLRITSGEDQLRCLRLTPKGLHRWYAGCCRTPVGNSHPRVAFVGLIHSILDPEVTPARRDEHLGPTRFRVHERFAAGPLPAGAPPKVNVAQVARAAALIVGWGFGGLGRPSPFFDPRTRAPRVAPQVLQRPA
jgi:hypothetical protein